MSAIRRVSSGQWLFRNSSVDGISRTGYDMNAVRRVSAGHRLFRNSSVDGISGTVCALSTANSGRDIVVPDFHDGRTAYEWKSSWALLRSLVVLKLCSVNFLVDNHAKLNSWGQQMLPQWLFSKLMKMTFYGHFVAGEDLREVILVRDQYQKLGIRSILDYSVEEDLPSETIKKSMGENVEIEESVVDSDIKRYKGYEEFADRRSPPPSARSYFYEGEDKCNENVNIFLQCIDASVCEDGSGIACVKVTALGELQILRHVSSKMYSLTKKQGHHRNILDVLSDQEQRQVQKIVDRMEKLSERAVSSGVRVMYDAEQTYFQSAIRWLVLQQMEKYNTEKPIIYSTYQCYLRDSEQMITEDTQLAEERGFHFAAKFVRGAYMVQEIARANKVKYRNPIHKTYNDTEISYHTNIQHALNLVKTGRCSLIVASHNERTVNFVLASMAKMGIYPDSPHVCFAQLLGMSDHISYLLGKHGYYVYKYMPYGPVADVMPYLGRRAEENRSVMEGTVGERELMTSELKRRWLRKS
ncbi:proline dehydrogenase 1, mitochondrial-like [Corticium candelabrum]|uniref:proline dehydrogenase 1, mitochondrial-like n=1 Tax=Corticium candelabrum TaxID=121492 RepID=UPI002E258434|nr:proline dehydrogenase 1, mitochondrial-like [Corticium candelabrum]